MHPKAEMAKQIFFFFRFVSLFALSDHKSTYFFAPYPQILAAVTGKSRYAGI